MKENRLDAAFALVMGYLAGVTVAFVVPVCVSWAWTGRAPFGSSLWDAFNLFFFGLYIVANLVIVAVPFLLVRVCGAFRNAWLSAVGGVITAFFALPIQVGAVIAVYMIFDAPPLPFISTLAKVAVAGWPLIASGGAAGGLTYWSIEWLFQRLFLWASTSEGRPTRYNGPAS
jgi:hypothetical protein